MPSTQKTPHLGLNRWVGTDKPKRDDWNNDNAKIDTALLQLEQTTLRHENNHEVHVTQSEKNKWNQGNGFTVFTYKGDGTNKRQFSVGKTITFGIVYAVNKQPIQVVPNNFGHFGFLSSQGCSEGLMLSPNGFTVSHDQVVSPSGYALHLNQTGVKYLCFYY